MTDNAKKEKNGIFIDSVHALDEEEVVEALIRSGEGQKVEFKSKLPQLYLISSDMAAFANTNGGLILYGVGDDGAVVGLTEKDIQRFEDVIMKALVQVTPCPETVSWKLVSYRGKYLGGVVVWPEEYAPFFVKESAFRRVGATNLKLNNEDILTSRNERTRFETLEISELEIKRFILAASEDAFTEVLLIPFLRHLGFRSVLGKGHEDKTLEFGQDIRSFKFQLPTGHWLFFAAQVKTGNLAYSAKKTTTNAKGLNIQEALTQARMAFEYEMFDLETNTMNLPDHVLLVATGEINEGARLFLSQSLSREKQRRLLMWEGNYLLERILKEGLPRGCQIEIKKYVQSISG